MDADRSQWPGAVQPLLPAGHQSRELAIKANLHLSTPQDLRLPLRWIAILYGRIKADLAATSGIHTAHDVLKMLMVGADVTMLCSVLLRQGLDSIRKIESEIADWLSEHDYQSVRQLQGSMSQKYCADPPPSNVRSICAQSCRIARHNRSQVSGLRSQVGF